MTAASPANPAVTSTANASFPMPSVQALALSAAPANAAPLPGTAVNVALQIQSAGNVPVTASLSSNASQGLTVAGLTSPVTLNPGQTITQNLSLTPAANATVGVPLTDTITATFGNGGNAQSVTTGVTVTPTSAQAQSAASGAQNASNLGRGDIAITLNGLSSAINSVVSSCSAPTQAQLLAYLDNLIIEMNAPFLASFTTDLTSARTAIASSTCGNIATALNQLSTVLSNLSNVLNSPAAFPFDFALIPNTAVAQPNQATQFQILLKNNSTVSNTYALSLGALPAGVTGNLNQNVITLAAGQSAPLPGGLTITLTPSTGTASEFSVIASINGVANSARTITGALTARSQFLQVEDVTATPGFTNPGGLVDVVTHIANVVNQNKTVQVVLNVLNSSNTTVLGPFTKNNVALSVQTLLTTVDFGQINTTGLAKGNYTLTVTVIDPATGQPIPGGTGAGTLLIGSPVTATLTASPQTLAPGNGLVTSTLTVSSTGGGSGGMPFSLIGSAATASPAESVAINGTTVYTCDNNEVSIFNAANPTNPTLIGTALAGAISNAQNIFCDIQRGDLVMLADAASTFTGNNPSFVAFDLTHPTAPSLIASTPVNKRFFGPPYYQGNTAFFRTQEISFGAGFPGPITDQAGDFVSLDVTNFSAPAVLGTLETQTHGPVFGGSFNIYGITPFSTQLAYAGSTTLQGGNLHNGVGQLWVVNTANPSALSIVTQVNVLGTVQLLSPLVQGSTAVAIGDNGGWISSCCAAGQQSLTGNVVVAVFDLANPQNPQVVANVTTTFLPGSGGGAAVIGPHQFLYSGVMDASNNNFLMLVDTTDPHNPVITTYPIATPINVMKAVGALLYAPTNSGLQIYSIPGLGAIQYTASVQIAKNGTAAYNANSFSVAPSSITPGAGFDTVKWVNPASNTITWTSNIAGIQPGQVVPVDLGGTVSFTVPAGSGTVTLPQADVNSDQIIGLNPGSQTVAPGQIAPYTLTVKNPTAASVTYNLAVTGVAQNWVTLQSSVSVPAGGQMTIPLSLRSEIAAVGATYGFIVTATSGGASGSVSGTLILQGSGIGAITSGTVLGVAATLPSPVASGGPGTTTNFTVQVTNVGNTADTYNLSIAAPSGVTATFDQTSIHVPPGLSNSRQVVLHLTPAVGTLPGPINFTVKAQSQTSAAVLSQATGTLTVTPFGVQVTLGPQVATPNSTLQMTVKNTGQNSDTFDLSLGGPAASVATLAINSVTLAAGQSRNVAITVGAVNFASLGNLTLTATATSRGNKAVLAGASAQITIGPSKGISATFDPAQQTLAAPGTAVFLLNVLNTGTLEDGYTATITGTTGPVQASLIGLTGNAAQAVTGFRIPGVSGAQLVLNALLSGLSLATVTVTITSNSDPTVKTSVTAILTGGTSCAGQFDFEDLFLSFWDLRSGVCDAAPQTPRI